MAKELDFKYDSAAAYARSELLLGHSVMERLSDARVIVFGLGGVGSWCAEGLLRSGVTHLTLVDDDRVSPTNLNRQAEATAITIGQPKTEALRNRLLEINPCAEIRTIDRAFTGESSAEFALDSYDYIIDAIDSMKDKIDLICNALACKHTILFSSMGAALKLDPTGVRVAPFSRVQGCPLAAALRRKMRRLGIYPKKEFLCVYDEEVLENKGVQAEIDKDPRKKRVNGSLVHITAIFGMTLTGLVIRDICLDKASDSPG